MVKLLRVVLVALIALAVPLQGALAVGTAQCLALEQHDGGGHDHSQGGHDRDSSSHDDSPASHSHCGPCVACCASASIALASALPVIPAAAFAVEVLQNSPLVGDPPGGLFRPPLAL